MSVYDNIAFGPRTHGVKGKAKLDDMVEEALRKAAIWDEVKDRLDKSALSFLVVSSSGSALPARWRYSRRFC